MTFAADPPSQFHIVERIILLNPPAGFDKGARRLAEERIVIPTELSASFYVTVRTVESAIDLEIKKATPIGKGLTWTLNDPVPLSRIYEIELSDSRLFGNKMLDRVQVAGWETQGQRFVFQLQGRWSWGRRIALGFNLVGGLLGTFQTIADLLDQQSGRRFGRKSCRISFIRESPILPSHRTHLLNMMGWPGGCFDSRNWRTMGLSFPIILHQRFALEMLVLRPQNGAVADSDGIND